MPVEYTLTQRQPVICWSDQMSASGTLQTLMPTLSISALEGSMSLNDPKQTFSTPWTCSSSETVANLMSPRRHHAGREPLPSSSWLFSVPWAVIVPMAVGGPFRIHSNITPINAPTNGPTI
jgi:hypothetical protein